MSSKQGMDSYPPLSNWFKPIKASNSKSITNTKVLKNKSAMNNDPFIGALWGAYLVFITWCVWTHFSVGAPMQSVIALWGFFIIGMITVITQID